jgi:hypothetical protein
VLRAESHSAFCAIFAYATPTIKESATRDKTREFVGTYKIHLTNKQINGE